MNVYEDIENAFAIYSIYLKESDEDTIISKEVFSTNINIKKLFKGVRGNYVLTLLYDVFEKSAEFKLEMPMRKVL